MVAPDEAALLPGKQLRSSDGLQVGRVAAVFASEDGSHLTFVAVLLADSRRVVLVPLVGGEMVADLLTVAFTADAIRTSPPVTEPLLPSHEQRSYVHYGVSVPAAIVADEDSGAAFRPTEDDRWTRSRGWDDGEPL